jgi:GT2 family glycosyltransferase
VPSLTVVIPATDQPGTLTAALAGVRAAADGPDELIVIDGPAELTVTEARNQGAARATSDIVVFIDADVVVHEDAFTRLRAAFTDPGVDAVFGSYDDSPHAPGVVSVFRNLLHHHVHQSGAGPAETFWTGLGAVRRSAFAAVGGFDEQRYRRPSIEDVDLGHRLAEVGARIVLDPDLQGTHLKRWTLRSMVWTDFARRGVPWVALLLRSRRPALGLNLRWRHRLSALLTLVGLAAILLRHPLAGAVALGGLLVCNAAFYGLLLRRQGPLRALVGVVLHAVHHLAAVAALPVGIGLAAVEAAGGLRAVRVERPTEATSAP